MKLFHFFLFIVISFQAVFAQPSNPESVTYSAYLNTYYISDAQTGKIFTSPDCKTDFEELTTGLNSPKGIFNEFDIYLWVTDVTEIVKINIETGEIEATIPIEGAVFLNDITMDYIGNIYVSDTQKGIIYNYNQFSDLTEIVKSNISAPNGLYYSDIYDKVYYVTFSNNAEIHSIDIEGNDNTVFESSQSMLDGIAFDNSYETAYISSWQSNSVYQISLETDENFDLVFGEEKLLQSGLNSPADIFYNTYKEELAVPLMNDGSIEIITFPPSLSKPNDLEYYTAENKLFISNNRTQKILYTELTEEIKDFDYKTFLSFPSIITSIQIFDDFIFASVQTDLHKIDIKTKEIVNSISANSFIDDFTVIDENNVIGITGYNNLMTFNFNANNVDYRENLRYTKLCSDDQYLYLIEEKKGSEFYLVKLSFDNSDSTSVSIPKNNYYRIEMIEGNLYVTYNNTAEDEFGVMIFNPTDLQLSDDISTTSDGSFPYGIVKAADKIYYTVILLDEIKILNEDTSVDEITKKSIKIYPNPAESLIKTEFENFNYKIIDILGNTVMNGHSNNSSIDISRISKGNYYIIIETNNQNYIQKFIKK